ncbi:MAG: hypothetical protein QW035_04565 [Candidatus Anstonellales archaeon]
MAAEWACIGCDGVVDPSKKKCYPVEEDVVIKNLRKIKISLNEFIRGFYKDFNIVKGYSICICEDHLKEFEEKRKKFERTLAINVIIAVVIIMALTFFPLIFTLSLNITGFFGSLLLAVIIILMSLIYYTPKASKEPIKEVKLKGRKAKG